jgi:hypothetical protein
MRDGERLVDLGFGFAQGLGFFQSGRRRLAFSLEAPRAQVGRGRSILSKTLRQLVSGRSRLPISTSSRGPRETRRLEGRFRGAGKGRFSWIFDERCGEARTLLTTPLDATCAPNA